MTINNDLASGLRALKENGEKCILDLDYCDIKENNYYKDTTNRGFTKAALANSGYKEQYIEQSVIVYRKKFGDIFEYFTSQPFPINSITLASHILNNEVVIYIDRLDKSKYLFEFISDTQK